MTDRRTALKSSIGSVLPLAEGTKARGRSSTATRTLSRRRVHFFTSTRVAKVRGRERSTRRAPAARPAVTTRSSSTAPLKTISGFRNLDSHAPVLSQGSSHSPPISDETVAAQT